MCLGKGSKSALAQGQWGMDLRILSREIRKDDIRDMVLQTVTFGVGWDGRWWDVTLRGPCLDNGRVLPGWVCAENRGALSP